MIEEKKYINRERLILETALSIMFQKGFDAVSIPKAADRLGVDPVYISGLYQTDDEMRMKAMEYAAVVWTRYVREDLGKIRDTKEKLRRLIRHYAAGTESYPDSLSLYIDIWKRIRNSAGGSEGFLRESLVRIYNYYFETFEELLREMTGTERAGIHLKLLSQIIVVISDGLHVQSLIQPGKLDLDGTARVISRMVECYLAG